ncbi:hypothetical protein JKI95_08590 [Corynebacterium aquatimens]|uniref:hypothetical protein n=1 Tax=Corynebacterium TaxID=1716 RepID=UPI001F1B5F10|nr:MULTISPECIES: hypothetical protein [Corynebacterium]QYH19248.1 hypothetical protein JKI95_08590 [Corynebacterium aquatimens]UIZ91865.1 hypothetical protein JZY91_09260 [Corynebacterium sp. CNCTC7651]
MEDTLVKSKKPVAVVAAVAASLALVGCSAGQITQTSSQVAAVDGATVFTEDGSLSVQDVTLVLSEDGDAALKFTATNQDPSMREHKLVSAEVAGQPVTLGSAQGIGYNCVLVADSKDGLDRIPQSDSACIQYVETSVENKDFAYAGNVPVKFTFDSGTIDVDATVAAPLLPSGKVERDVTK